MPYILAILVVGIDQAIKWLVRTHMALGQLIAVFPPALYITYIRNPGAAWSMFIHGRWFLVAVAIAVTLAVVYVDWKYRPRSIWVRIAMGLIMGGALGNMIDRVLTGTVVDYVYFRSINFPIFNFADVSIDVGVGLVILMNILGERDSRKSKDVE